MKDFCVRASYPSTSFILTSLSINDEYLQYKIQTQSEQYIERSTCNFDTTFLK